MYQKVKRALKPARAGSVFACESRFLNDLALELEKLKKIFHQLAQISSANRLQIMAIVQQLIQNKRTPQQEEWTNIQGRKKVEAPKLLYCLEHF